MLGDHVAQKGSLVAPDRLRFDFSHHEADVAPRRSRAVEDMANAIDAAELAGRDAADGASTKPSPPARMALFGEKYGDEVRVVSMGAMPTASEPATRIRSSSAAARMSGAPAISACSRSSRESAVAAGVRRIEALTGEPRASISPRRMTRARGGRAAQGRRPTKCSSGWRPSSRSAASWSASSPTRKREIALGGGSGGGAADNLDPRAEWREAARPRRPRRRAEGSARPDRRRQEADWARASSPLSASAEDGKAGLVVGVTADLTGRYNAVELVRVGAEALGGKGGGGRPDLAQAGGADGRTRRAGARGDRGEDFARGRFGRGRGKAPRGKRLGHARH